MTKIVYLPKPFVLKPYTKKELRCMYDLTNHVFSSWLKAIEPKIGKPLCGKYNILQVELIIQTYGVPGQYVNEAA